MIPALIPALLLACAAHRLPSPAPTPAGDLVYFVLVDRFANGDPSNDEAVDPADPAAFHGGDLAGVRARLDELAALGVKTLWLSPVFEMQTDKVDGHGAFHGYWTTDLGAIEPRFGDERELRRLVRAAHARGMRVALDLVLNHTGYEAPLTRTRPAWFHGQGDVVDWADPLERVNHDVHGLPDLALEREDVWRYQRARALGWVERTGIDGYRVDAVRHMPLTAQARMVEDLRAAHAGLWLLGEVFDGDPRTLAETLRGTGYSAVFDFPLHYAMIDTLCKGQPVGRLASTLSLDRLYGDLLRDHPGALVTFLDNHDVPRLVSQCGGDVGRATVALAVLMGMRGTPSLSWGTEAALSGAGEPENRASMPWDGPMPLAGPIRELAAMRAAHPVLAGGSTRILAFSDTSLTLTRLDERERAFITLNLGAEPMPLAGAAPGQETFAETVVIDAAGRISSGETVPAGGVGFSFWRKPGLYELEARGAWRPPPRRVVQLQVSPPPLAPGETLVWVGAGPELGHWDPRRGVEVSADGRARVEVPTGAVLASKLVIRGADGGARWEGGGDRYLHVVQGDGPLDHSMAWQAP